MVRWCSRSLEPMEHRALQDHRGRQGPRGPRETLETRERMAKQDLEGSQGHLETQEPRDRRVNVVRVNQDREAPLDLQAPLQETDLHMWTWKVLGSLTQRD